VTNAKAYIKIQGETTIQV